MKKLTTEEKKFVIDQIRKDKIIYATEACAVALISLLFFFVSTYISEPLIYVVQGGAALVTLVYGLYMGIGNYKRLIRIKALEKELQLEI